MRIPRAKIPWCTCCLRILWSDLKRGGLLDYVPSSGCHCLSLWRSWLVSWQGSVFSILFFINLPKP